MTPTLPITDADLISVQGAQALPGRIAAFPDQLQHVLGQLERILKANDAYGPDPDLEREYMCLRGWLVHHYGRVRHALRDPRGGRESAWSLDSSAADRLYRIISPARLSRVSPGASAWSSAVAAALQRAAQA